MDPNTEKRLLIIPGLLDLIMDPFTRGSFFANKDDDS